MTRTRGSPIAPRVRTALPLLLLVAGCGRASDAGLPPGKAVACVLGGKAASCTAETLAGGAMILHRPDGGFRRLAIADGRLVAADGAEPATISPLTGGGIRIAIGGDRYDLPAGR